MRSIIVLLGLVCVSRAQVLELGRCPRVSVQSDFNVTQYLGTWYEYERFPFIPERNLKCVKAEYELDEGEFKVKNTGVRKRSGTRSTIEGIGNIPDPDTPAKLDIRFFIIQKPDPYWVLETDYSTYSIVLSCNNLGLLHTEIVWILARSRNGISQATLDSIYSTLRRYRINTRKLERTDQTGCENTKMTESTPVDNGD